MYTLQEEIKLIDRCSSINIAEKFFTITDGSYLKIFSIDNLNHFHNEPRYTIRNENTIVYSKIQGDSKIV
jgi:hypothetical protein